MNHQQYHVLPILNVESNIQKNNLKSVYESFARVSFTAQLNETALESHHRF